MEILESSLLEIRFFLQVKKDVLRTDRKQSFYSGDENNKNVKALLNILTTYSLNHEISYCQGMSDL